MVNWKTVKWKQIPWRQVVPPALLAFGILLLGYVMIQYANMYFTQRDLARRWAQQQQPAVQTTSSSSQSKPADDGLIRLTIPKINLDSVVVEGTTHKALLVGPGHIESTPEPGDEGNAAVSGHRDTFFRHIHELDKGDVITVQRGGRTYHYEVTGKKIVPPDDVSVLDPTPDSELTLITCYPTYYIGPAPNRLVVFSKLVPQNDKQAANTSAAQGAAAH